MTYPSDPNQGWQSGSEGQDYPPVGPGYGYFPAGGEYPPVGQYPQPYPQPYPQYYYPAYPPPPPGTNGMAIAALITAVAGLSLCGFPSALGLIFGIVSLQQIKKSGEQGRGLAIAGIVVGGIAAAAILAWLGIIIVASSRS